MPQNSPDIATDARALAEAGNRFLDHSMATGAAEAFQKELEDIASHGYDYTIKVFNKVKEDVGVDNWFTRSAEGVGENTLCFFPSLFEQPDSTFMCAFASGNVGGRDQAGVDHDIKASKYYP